MCRSSNSFQTTAVPAMFGSFFPNYSCAGIVLLFMNMVCLTYLWANMFISDPHFSFSKMFWDIHDMLTFDVLFGWFPSNGKKGVPSAESFRSVRGLGKGVSGKPYPRLCNARRPRLEPGTFRSQAGPSQVTET